MNTNEEIASKLNFDLEEHKRQVLLLKEVATKEIAYSLSEMRRHLARVMSLIESSGVQTNLQEFRYAVEDVEALHPDWNTSSYECP